MTKRQKDLPEELRQLGSDGIEEGLVGFDPGQRIVLWNRAAETIFRIAAPQALGQRLSEVAPLQQLAGSGQGLAASPGATESRQGRIEFRPEDPGGTTTVRYQVLASHDSAGAVNGGVIVISDVTREEKYLAAFEMLKDISRQAAECQDISVCLQYLIARVCELLGAESGLVLLLEPASGNYRLSAVHNLPDELARLFDTVKPGERLSGKMLAQGATYACPEILEEQEAHPQVKKSGFRSGIQVPLTIFNEQEKLRVIGAIIVIWKVPRAYEPEDVQLLEAVAGEAALVLTNLKTGLEREQALTDLQFTNQNLTEFITKSSEGILWIRDRKIIFANPAALQILRAEKVQDLLGRDALDLLPAEDRSLSEKLKQEFQAKGQPPEQTRFNIIRLDGSAMIGELSYAIVLTEGGLPIIQVALRDVTERVQAEKNLLASENQHRLLLELAPEGIISIDPEGRIIFANLWASELLGYCHGTLPGRSIAELVESSWVPVISELFREGREQTVEQEELPFKKEDGRSVDCMVNAGPVYDERNHFQGYIIFLTDLSETKGLREQLYFADKMTAIGRLAGGIAHEFNNINAAIQGYVELIAREPHLTAQDKEDLAAIRQLIQRATQITHQLLIFARHDAPYKESTDLVTLVDANARLVEKEYASQGIQLTVAHQAPLPLIKLHPGRIGQIIMELIINAHDAVLEGPGPKKIELATGQQEDRVFIQVRDSGVGISAEARKKLFDPFYTTKGALGGSVIPGTGLGLSVAVAVVADYGGTIEVQSRPGEGATFIVWLPLGQNAPPLVTRASRFGTVVTGARILIVDDEPDIAELLKRAMEGAGYLVETANQGLEAIHKLRQSTHDVLLLDLQMPDLPGEEVLRELQSFPEHLRPLPIIITGKPGLTLTQELLDLGAKQVLGKPFPLEAVFTAVYDALVKKATSA